MGFLDHTTNNIILDAVLTDKGRQLLANGAGNFNIAKFAFGDDEVDYSIIQKFGRTVGKEKIEKNTPVLEASTTGYLGIKYRNLSLNNDSLSILPVLSLENTLVSNAVTLYRSQVSGDQSVTITIKQKAPSGVQIDSDASDFSFRVTIDSLFLRIANAWPDNIDNYNMATYTIPMTSIDSNNLTTVQFSLQARSVSQDVFSSHSYLDGGTATVTREIGVSGYNTGQSTYFNVNIL
jgi:hypothetical protein